MFVQVMRGHVTDAEQVHAALDQWSRELGPEAPGWLGSTAGVTEDGEFVGLARFESAEAARRNSDRPEQSDWWSNLSRLFTTDISVRDSDDVMVDINGDPDDARFVQIMQGRGTDPERAKELMEQNPEEWAAYRPDVIGSIAADQSSGEYTVALYFTSEQAAREGEKKEPPPELKAQMDEMEKLNIGEPEFLDLKNPWLYSS